MKCPKCGYLGFETTDRCRNCQYDFSLAPFTADPDLTLHGNDRQAASPSEFDLPPVKRPTDRLSTTALDLDRLFGAPEPSPIDLAAAAMGPGPEPARELNMAVDAPAAPTPVDAPLAMAPPEPISEPEPAPEPEFEPAPEPVLLSTPDVQPDPIAESEPELMIDDERALPFDDAPLVPPPAARPPLAVRRSTPEVPRNRPRTTRPVRMDSLEFEAPAAAKSASTARAATDTVASLMEAPSVGVRVGAGVIDLLLLVGIDAAVVYLTLRVTGLTNSLDDVRVLAPIPFVGFLLLLAFGYVAAFTVAGGQTIGKMVLNLRVIGDDGRPVDAAGGMLRALGCMLVPVTLGLSYLPVLFANDHRALHDRLAGTRVVQE